MRKLLATAILGATALAGSAGFMSAHAASKGCYTYPGASSCDFQTAGGTGVEGVVASAAWTVTYVDADNVVQTFASGDAGVFGSDLGNLGTFDAGTLYTFTVDGSGGGAAGDTDAIADMLP